MTVVQVKQGKLEGFTSKSNLTGNEYYAFVGIPYGKPPIGDLRFRPPQPVEKWDGILEAKKPGSPCSQFDLFINKQIGNEDCLYLNVYTPLPPSKIEKPKAVLVFIHGGAFCGGSAHPDVYSPDYLINYDVILVTLNYRLHALGFLDLGTDDCPGNCGLKDQLLALKWIKQNIASFGGDANNITLVGESAGAVSVHMHMLSPSSKGLFHKAILQSGHAFVVWCLQKAPRQNALKLARRLGYASNDGDTLKILEFLKTQPVEDICKATSNIDREYTTTFPGMLGNLLFVPTVETAKGDVFLPDRPEILVKKATPLPLMSGMNDKEGRLGIFTWSQAIFKGLDENLPKIIQNNTGIECDQSKAEAIAQEVRRYYFKNQPIDLNTIDDVVDLNSDFFFGIKYYDAFDYITKSSSPVYLYEFSFHGERNFFTNILKKEFPSFTSGAGHADDLLYLFQKRNLFAKEEVNDPELTVVRNFCTLCANFAKYGNPVRGMENVEWKPYTPEKPCYLRIDKGLEVIPKRHLSKGTDFWKKYLYN